LYPCFGRVGRMPGIITASCLGFFSHHAIRLLSLLFVIVIIFSACTSRSIFEDSKFNPPVYWGNHSVKSGDTLITIAWLYGRDYLELAEINRIPPPYHIYPGQRISLAVPDGYTRNTEQYKDAQRQASSATRKPTKKPVKSGGSSRINKKIHSPEKLVYKSQRTPEAKWIWPHPGPIIDLFTTTGDINKGVDIAGKKGDPIKAAASGEVVYAGSGLLGYGNLVIINHSERFLSAYAHNSIVLVSEGETIEQGQKIAELGSTGASKPKLHFEIRKDGKPVDPLSYLPKR